MVFGARRTKQEFRQKCRRVILACRDIVGTIFRVCDRVIQGYNSLSGQYLLVLLPWPLPLPLSSSRSRLGLIHRGSRWSRKWCGALGVSCRYFIPVLQYIAVRSNTIMTSWGSCRTCQGKPALLGHHCCGSTECRIWHVVLIVEKRIQLRRIVVCVIRSRRWVTIASRLVLTRSGICLRDQT